MDVAPAICPLCLRPGAVPVLSFDQPYDRPLIELIAHNHPRWSPEQGICRRCLAKFDRVLVKLQRYHPAFTDHASWIIPTPVRLDTDDRYTGRGVTIAFLDSGFYLHPDLVKPDNRIRAYVNILREHVSVGELHQEMTQPHVDAWHGMMTSVVAAGNGYLSHGVYRGIAYEATVVLVKVGSARRIYHDDIRRGIEWVIAHRREYDIRVLNISCGGDYEASYLVDPLAQAADAAVREGIVVVAAAGNKGHEPRHPVIAPANAPSVITVGGLDDNNQLDWSGFRMYRSSYGPTLDGLQKPEIIAPSIWLAAPILPGTPVAAQARLLELICQAPLRRVKALLQAHPGVEPILDQASDQSPITLQKLARELMRANNVISQHYKHVDGTSFAAPIVSSIVAQMLQANPQLTPQQVKLALIESARRLPRYEVDKQGWGVINPRRAVRRALQLAQRTHPHDDQPHANRP